MKTATIHIDQLSDSAIIGCPNCRKDTEVPRALLGAKHHLKVKCACENIFLVEIESREKPRIRVDLPGFYEVTNKTTGKNNSAHKISPGQDPASHTGMNCLVADLSGNGIGFIALDDQQLKFGDFVVLYFQLDDRQKSTVKQTCLIKHVNDNFVGCRMLQENTSLGLYLLGKD